MAWDIFISYSRGNKKTVAWPLAVALRKCGLQVWFDDTMIEPGTAVSAKIDEGIANSRFAVVALSPDYFASNWAMAELNAIITKEKNCTPNILIPVLYNMTHKDLQHRSPLLAGLKTIQFEDGLEATVNAIRKAISHDTKADSDFVPPALDHNEWAGVLYKRLFDEFNATEGVYQGFFGGFTTAVNSKKWQAKSGEIVDSIVAPKLPYYHTYWAYEAAFRIAPDRLATWKPITLAAIERHFAGQRWLKVPCKYSFTEGPRASLHMASSIRHTARAAELLHLLSLEHQIVSQVAWDLINEAPKLQQKDGGWPEFYDSPDSTSIWATVYTYRFLSKLALENRNMPDEPDLFLIKVKPILDKTELCLKSHWRSNNWTYDTEITTEEAATSVLTEIGPFFSDRTFITDICQTLKNTISPSGRLLAPTISGGPSETIRALHIAIALKLAGKNLFVSDTRFKKLLEWLLQNLALNTLELYDIGFMAMLYSNEAPK